VAPAFSVDVVNS